VIVSKPALRPELTPRFFKVSLQSFRESFGVLVEFISISLEHTRVLDHPRTAFIGSDSSPTHEHSVLMRPSAPARVT